MITGTIGVIWGRGKEGNCPHRYLTEWAIVSFYLIDF